MRVGIGYDIHRFDEAAGSPGQGRPLVLGGVEFSGEPGLAGHSDADVLTHAIIDAVLGAAALGDIGTHFPPDDPQWADADSMHLLDRTVALLAEGRYAVESVDATVIAERPRLSPHVGEMRDRLAAALGIDRSRVSVKASTNEGIGALGRGEGIAAMAVAVVREMSF